MPDAATSRATEATDRPASPSSVVAATLLAVRAAARNNECRCGDTVPAAWA